MRENVRNFLVGIVSLGGLVMLAILLTLFGELDRIIEPRYVLTIQTDHAAGLRPGSSVELNGVPIGEIGSVTTQDDRTRPVRVSVLIERDVRIPDSAVPFVATSLLGGAAILQIEVLAAEAAVTYLPRDGTATIVSPLRVQMVEQIKAELDARMGPLMEALAKFDELSDTYIAFGRQLNELMHEQNPEALAAGEPPNIRSAIAQFYVVLENAREALALAREWLGDEQMRTDAREAVAKANRLIDQASETLDRFTRLAGNLESNADDLVGRLLPVTDELGATLEEVRRLTRLATEGQGTVALLMNNPDLYNSLEDTAVRLEQALRAIQLFVDKVKAEGLPLRY